MMPSSTEVSNSASNAGEPDAWQTKISSVREGVKYVLDNNKFMDVTFIVKGQRFPGHRLIFAARSTKFAEEILRDASLKEFTLEDISPTAFNLLRKYMYTDELGSEEKNDILEVYAASVKYGPKGLTAKCEEFFQGWIVDESTICDLLSLANDHEAQFLLDRCFAYLGAHTKKVLESEAFKNADLTTVEMIIKSKEVDVYQSGSDAVMLVLNCVIHWASKQYPEPIESGTDKEMRDSKVKHYGQVRNYIKCMLPCLQFSKLASNQLIIFHGQCPGFLSAEQFEHIAINHTNPIFQL